MLPLVLLLFLSVASSCLISCENGYCNNSTLECVCLEGWEGASCAVAVKESFTTPQGWFFLVWGILITIFALVALGLLLLHRDTATKYPQMVVFSSLVLLVINSSILIKRVRPGFYSCSLNYFLFTPVLGLALWTMFLRTFFIYRLFLATADRVRRRERTQRGEEVLVGPKCCPLESTEYLFFMGGLIVITVLSIVFAPFTLDSMSEPTIVCNHYASGITVVMLAILASSWLYISCRLRKMFDDTYGVKTEFKLLLTICFGMLLVLPVSFSAVVRDYSNTFSFTALFVGLGVTGLLLASTCYPLSKLHLPHYEIGHEALFLKDVLDDQPNGREAFWKYLVSEFDAQSLMLFEAIERFQAMHVAFGRTHPGRIPERQDRLAQLGVMIQVDTVKPPEDCMVGQFIRKGVEEEKLFAFATQIHAQYIATGAPDRVILSGETCSQLNEIFLFANHTISNNNNINNNNNNINNNNNNLRWCGVHPFAASTAMATSTATSTAPTTAPTTITATDTTTSTTSTTSTTPTTSTSSTATTSNTSSTATSAIDAPIVIANDDHYYKLAQAVLLGVLFDKAKEEIETNFRRGSFNRFCCSASGERYKVERGIPTNILRGGIISHFRFLLHEFIVSFCTSLCSL